MEALKAKTFRSHVTKKLSEGRDGLEWLVRAFGWAHHHLREIHREWPEYRQEWLENEIKKTFNVSPCQYLRTAVRIGGGPSEDQVNKGFRRIQKFGIWETFRAERVLGNTEWEMLRSRLDNIQDSDGFKKAVADLSPRTPHTRKTDDEHTCTWKHKYEEALKIIERLRKQLAMIKTMAVKAEGDPQ